MCFSDLTLGLEGFRRRLLRRGGKGLLNGKRRSGSEGVYGCDSGWGGSDVISARGGGVSERSP